MGDGVVPPIPFGVLIDASLDVVLTIECIVVIVLGRLVVAIDVRGGVVELASTEMLPEGNSGKSSSSFARTERCELMALFLCL